MKLKSLKHLLFLSLLLVLTACQQELYKSNNKYNIPEKSAETPLVQFLIEPTNYSAIAETENLAKAYDYSKIAHNTLWINKFNEKLTIAPTTRVVTLHETAGLNDIAVDSLLKFVSKGGTLFVTKATKDERMSFFYGMTPAADWRTNTQASGLAFNKPLFPGMEGYTFNNKTVHRGFSASNFSNDINILVSSYNDKEYPVLIENKIGNGKVVFYNSSEILKKEMRGLLFAATLIGLEGIPYPIANVSTLFLDDFPSPGYDIQGMPLRSNIGEPKSQFIRSDWWPKMKELAKENNIKYTAYTTFNSDSKIDGNFSFDAWEKSSLMDGVQVDGSNSWLTNELIKQGHELGFRGYNNAPLINSVWRNTDTMLEAAKQSEKKWKESVFKELPVSYVAPNNQIDSLGLVALKKGFPSLNYLHTSFAGDLEKGGNREFDPDPLNSRFFDYPRISNGYDISPAQRWDIESTYLYTGIWTHVLNHKTIFESGSSDNSLKSFKNQINDFKKRHPYTRFLPAKLATEATMDWRYQSVRHLNFEGQYEVSSSINSDAMKPSFWLMYIDSKNDQKLTKRLADEQVNYESVPFLNGFLYHIKTFSPSVSVPDIRPQIQNLVGTTTSVVGQTNKEYSKFNNSKETLVPLGKQIDRLIAEEKPEQASVLMENLFEDNKFINKNQIISYAQFMKQLGKEKELWNQLNELYTTNPSKNFASLAYTVSKINGFPSQETKKIWLERLLEWQSENTEILKEYYTNFNTPDNERIISQVLETLAALNPTKENIKNYLDFLIKTQSDRLLTALDTIEVCSLDDKELSTAISLAYADQLNFDKALLWLKCSTQIEPQIVQEWQLKSKNFEGKKVSDFPYYIEYLLVNNQERAIVEIQNIPICRPDLKLLAKPIALLLGEYMQPKKALEWSHCAQDIPVKQLMDWNAEVGDIAQLKKVYYEHMSQNSRDYEIMNYMAQLLLLNGHTEDAGKTALSIPANKLDPDFKIAFNNEVQQETDKTRTLYINTFKILMDDAIVRKSKIQRRKQKGHSIGFTSNMWADKFDPTLVNNLFHFGFYNKNEDFHRFSISQANAYIILKDTLIANDQGRDLLGLEYKFSKESSEKNPYYLSARVEMDNFNSFYFHFNSGIDFIGENSKTTLEVNTHPVRTGPGYVLNIYDLGLMAQQSFNYTKNLKQSFTVNGSYFTDNQYYGTGSSRIDYSLINLDKFSLGPLLEGSYSLGSEERRDGFPYWLTENRLFGGGGLSIQIGNEKSDFLLKTDFSLFTEKDEANFERYQGKLSYRIKDFTQINLGYKYFTIDKFFSNAFQLGIQYNFK